MQGLDIGSSSLFIPSCHYLKNKFRMFLDIYIFPFHDHIFKKVKWLDMANHIYRPMITSMILSSFKKLFNLIHTMFKCLKFEFLFNHIFQESKYKKYIYIELNMKGLKISRISIFQQHSVKLQSLVLIPISIQTVNESNIADIPNMMTIH